MISAATENTTTPSESGIEGTRVTFWRYSPGFTFLVFYKLVNADRTPTDLLKSGRPKSQLASQEADGAPPTTLLGWGEGAGLRSEDYDDPAENNSGRDDLDNQEGIDYVVRIEKGKARKRSRRVSKGSGTPGQNQIGDRGGSGSRGHRRGCQHVQHLIRSRSLIANQGSSEYDTEADTLHLRLHNPGADRRSSLHDNLRRAHAGNSVRGSSHHPTGSGLGGSRRDADHACSYAKPDRYRAHVGRHAAAATQTAPLQAYLDEPFHEGRRPRSIAGLYPTKIRRGLRHRGCRDHGLL
ncbi:MAG: hypothetical protein LQ337_003327 [Flavoplaca oasis]|nr:MAG: hypothetical protein LQ337_003327 [Flavoplaca oasis]